MTTKYLRIYLNDHRAGALAGLELVKRARSSNQGTELGEYLLSFEAEVREDLRALEEAMRSLGVPLNQIKAGAAWLAEKLGRAKLHGQVRGHSPLSRLIELEGLGLAVEGKRRLWTTLERLAERDARVDGERMQDLIARADRQLVELETWRLRAAETALGIPPIPTDTPAPSAG